MDLDIAVWYIEMLLDHFGSLSDQIRETISSLMDDCILNDLLAPHKSAEEQTSSKMEWSYIKDDIDTQACEVTTYRCKCFRMIAIQARNGLAFRTIRRSLQDQYSTGALASMGCITEANSSMRAQTFSAMSLQPFENFISSPSL